ncbi:hypothetical protein Bca52824_046129 [Brassica carinata]|uniref:Uncharacterized protein n=1 Tax=Brassica carinata TaxID=52824 RepID=A0A8X7RGM2_BRACI|nr:hypothetical protein Bca52824_046129 [Brassica carinata]
MTITLARGTTSKNRRLPKHHTRKLHPTRFVRTPHRTPTSKESSELVIGLTASPSSHKNQPQPPILRIRRQQLTTTAEVDD